MALRNEHQIVDAENAIPSRDPDKALERLEREIANGVIEDRIDLEAALGSWEYRQLPDTTREQLRARFPETS
jgi:hypothetical protein